MWVLRKESIARVDGVGAAGHRGGDDLVDVQVGTDRMADGADLVGLVGLQSVYRVAVLERVHRHGGDAQFARSTEGPDGNLAAIGHQQLRNHDRPLYLMASVDATAPTRSESTN